MNLTLDDIGHRLEKKKNLTTYLSSHELEVQGQTSRLYYIIIIITIIITILVDRNSISKQVERLRLYWEQ